MPRTQDTFRGCLVGGAAGDALGYAVEFLNEEWIRNRYGSAGISEYALINGVAAALVHIIRKICEGMSVRDAVVDSVSAVARVFEDKEHIIDFVKLMNEAVELADSDEDDLTAIHKLGEGRRA